MKMASVATIEKRKPLGSHSHVHAPLAHASRRWGAWVSVSVPGLVSTAARIIRACFSVVLVPLFTTPVG